MFYSHSVLVCERKVSSPGSTGCWCWQLWHTDLPLAGSWGMICMVPLLLGLGTERQGWVSSCMYISSCSTYSWGAAHVRLSSGNIQIRGSFCKESKMCTVGSPWHGQGRILPFCMSLTLPDPMLQVHPSPTYLTLTYRTSGIPSITRQE